MEAETSRTRTTRTDRANEGRYDATGGRVDLREEKATTTVEDSSNGVSREDKRVTEVGEREKRRQDTNSKEHTQRERERSRSAPEPADWPWHVSGPDSLFLTYEPDDMTILYFILA